MKFDKTAAPVGGYDLIVFDWDGTIFDTTAGIALSIQHAAEKMRLPVPSTAKAKSVIGLGWRDALKMIFPTLPAEEYPVFTQHYAERYRPAESEFHLFAGIEEVLAGLKASGIELAVATGKSRRGLNRVLDQTGLGQYFVATQTADENLPKPNPEMLEAIGMKTGIAPERTIMVGDTMHDLFMSRRYGCRGIAVTYGAMTKEMLAEGEPVVVCGSVDELARALGRID